MNDGDDADHDEIKGGIENRPKMASETALSREPTFGETERATKKSKQTEPEMRLWNAAAARAHTHTQAQKQGSDAKCSSACQPQPLIFEAFFFFFFFC